MVLIGSLGIYMVERWMRAPDAPIVGNAFIADGDTLTIAGTRIRLIDIDAPELDQTCLDGQGHDWPCGRQASAQLRSRTRGSDLSCQPKSRDQYGRTLATCTLPDGSNINAWMVEQGWAVTSGLSNAYGAQQTNAKSAKARRVGGIVRAAAAVAAAASARGQGPQRTDCDTAQLAFARHGCSRRCRSVEAGCFRNIAAGLIGRGTKFPLQFGHAP